MDLARSAQERERGGSAERHRLRAIEFDGHVDRYAGAKVMHFIEFVSYTRVMRGKAKRAAARQKPASASSHSTLVGRASVGMTSLGVLRTYSSNSINIADTLSFATGRHPTLLRCEMKEGETSAMSSRWSPALAASCGGRRRLLR